MPNYQHLRVAERSSRLVEDDGGGIVVPLHGPTRRADLFAASRPAASRDEFFCSYCGHGLDAAWRGQPRRVCRHCGLGIMLETLAGNAPAPADLFLVVDSELSIQAASRTVEHALRISEPALLHTPLQSVLTVAVSDRRRLSRLARRAAARRQSAHDIALCAANDRQTSFSGAVTSCWWPRAALLRLTPMAH